VTLLPQLRNSALAERFSLDKYRKIMSYPIWNYVSQGIFTSRSYRDGLGGSRLLLRLTEYYKPKLKRKEYELNLRKLYSFVLNMLDRLDRWEEYLDLWEKLFREVPLADTYNKDVRNYHGEEMQQFVLEEDEHILYVHFLWGTKNLRDVIRRKLLKKRSGKKIDYLLHAQQDQLTDSEIQRRVERLYQWIKAAQNMSWR